MTELKFGHVRQVVMHSNVCISHISRAVLHPQRMAPFRPLTRHHVVSQRRNNVQGVQLFESADAHRSEVADVAIVAVVGRRISVLSINARARIGVVSV